MCCLVRELDDQVIAKPHDARGDQLGQVARVVAYLLCVPASGTGVVESFPDPTLDVVGVAGAGSVGQTIESPAARDCNTRYVPDENDEPRDEQDHLGFHESSMAHWYEFDSAGRLAARLADRYATQVQGLKSLQRAVVPDLPIESRATFRR